MHRAHFLPKARLPHIFHRKNQNRRKPGGQTVKGQVQNSACGAAPQRVFGVAIKTIFTNIKKHRGKIGCSKGEKLLEHTLKIIFCIAFAYLLVELGQTVQHPAL